MPIEKSDTADLHPAFAGFDYPENSISRPGEVAKLTKVICGLGFSPLASLVAATLYDQGRAHEALSVLQDERDRAEAAAEARRARGVR